VTEFASGSNEYELPESLFTDLLVFSEKNNFTFEIKVIEEKDFQNKFHIIYELLSYTETLLVIRNRRAKNEEYIISIYNYDYSSIITILECKSGETIKLNIEELDSKPSVEIEILKELYKMIDSHNSKFEIEKFIHMYSVLINQYQSNTTYQNKLRSFKYVILSKIKDRKQGNFLCNCVPGFAPDISFCILGDKIVSSLDNNTISHSSEQKILKYLFKQENQKYIGKRKRLSIMDLFLHRKINCNIAGFNTNALINYVKEEGNGMIKINIFDGNKTHSVNKLFKKEELLEQIQNSH